MRETSSFQEGRKKEKGGGNTKKFSLKCEGTFCNLSSNKKAHWLRGGWDSLKTEVQVELAKDGDSAGSAWKNDCRANSTKASSRMSYADIWDFYLQILGAL